MIGLSWRLGLRGLLAQSLLMWVLIAATALPVAMVSLFASVQATSAFTPEEIQALAMGRADYVVRAPASNPREPPVPVDGIVAGRGTLVDDRDLTTEIIPVGHASVQSTGRILDLTNPLTTGIYATAAGTPASSGVALSAALAQRLDVGVGNVVHLPGIGDSVQVTALLNFAPDLGREFFVLGPDTFPPSVPAFIADSLGSPRWLLGDVTDVSVVDDLAAAGYSVTSARQVVDDFQGYTQAAVPPWLVLIVVVVTGFAVLATGLAIQARRLRSQAELLSAVGAPASVTITSALIAALVVWAVGCAIGSVLGLLSAGPVTHALSAAAHQDWGSLQRSWSTTGIAVGLAWGVAIVSSVLASRPRHPRPVPRRSGAWAGAGVLGLVLGVTASVLFSGSALGFVGVLVGSGGLLLVAATALSEGAARFGPAASIRLANRTVAQNPRTVRGGVMALGLVMILSVSISVVASDVADWHEQSYAPALPSHGALVSLKQELNGPDTLRIGQQLGADAARFSPAMVNDSGQSIPLVVHNEFVDCLRAKKSLEQCVDAAPEGVMNAGVAVVPTLVEAQTLAGTEFDPNQADAFQHGDGIILQTGSDLPPTRQVELVPPANPTRQPPPATSMTLQPAVVPVDRIYRGVPTLMLSPRAAERLGIGTSGSRETYLFLSPVSGRELGQSVIREALPGEAGVGATISIEQGPPYSGPLRAVGRIAGIGGLTLDLLIAVVMSLLWTLDLRTELRLLTMLGARRISTVCVAGWRSGVTALVAVAAAFIGSAFAVRGITATLGVRIPTGWVTACAPFLIVPIIAGAVAAMSTMTAVRSAPALDAN